MDAYKRELLNEIAELKRQINLLETDRPDIYHLDCNPRERIWGLCSLQDRIWDLQDEIDDIDRANGITP